MALLIFNTSPSTLTIYAFTTFIMTKGRVLVIAGSDSSGGAGLEADQKVIAAHGCYGMTATTALTAQNTLGVQDIHYTPPDFVKKLITACISDIGVDTVKTGAYCCFTCLNPS
jgi:hydroxymethylpyrimidine kinase/phosphomethylpyrimidine kinase